MIAKQMKRRRITSSYYNYFYNKHIPYINKIINSVKKGRNFVLDDIQSIGYEQLLRSMIYYNRAYSSDLKTYLTHRVYGCARTIVNKDLRQKRQRENYIQSVPNNYDCVYNNDTYMILEELFVHLNEREKKLFIMKFIEQKSASEIAEELSIVKPTVYLIEKRAIKKLKGIFNEQAA